MVVNSGRTNFIAIILKGSLRAMSFVTMYHQTHRFVHSSFPTCKSLQLDPSGNVCLLIQLSSRSYVAAPPTLICLTRVWLPQRRGFRLPREQNKLPTTRSKSKLPPRLGHTAHQAAPYQILQPRFIPQNSSYSCPPPSLSLPLRHPQRCPWKEP